MAYNSLFTFSLQDLPQILFISKVKTTLGLNSIEINIGHFIESTNFFLLEDKWRGSYHFFLSYKEQISLGVKQSNKSDPTSNVGTFYYLKVTLDFGQ